VLRSPSATTSSAEGQAERPYAIRKPKDYASRNRGPGPTGHLESGSAWSHLEAFHARTWSPGGTWWNYTSHSRAATVSWITGEEDAFRTRAIQVDGAQNSRPSLRGVQKRQIRLFVSRLGHPAQRCVERAHRTHTRSSTRWFRALRHS